VQFTLSSGEVISIERNAVPADSGRRLLENLTYLLYLVCSSKAIEQPYLPFDCSGLIGVDTEF
jgi:hypothetical protein